MVTRKDVPEAGMKILREKCEVITCETHEREEFLTKCKGVDGMFWVYERDLNAEVFDTAGPQLKSISTMSNGIDFVDLEEIKRRKIRLGHVPNASNDAVADVWSWTGNCRFKTVSGRSIGS